MATSGYREEVFNVLLALLLHEREVVAAPEHSFREALQQRRHVPDVLVVFHGLRTVIEGKVAGKADAGEKALAQARDRVEHGVAHIGIALLYPPSIRKAHTLTELQDVLSTCTFSIAVCSEAGETGWTEGGLDYLADLLRRTFDQLVREDVVEKAVDTLNTGIESFVRSTFSAPATMQRAAEILGIRQLPKRGRGRTKGDER